MLNPNQLRLFPNSKYRVQPFNQQLLKWIGNKQRFAHEIIGYFPPHYHTYYEPFLGSGAVLGTLAPEKAVASDLLEPLMDIWITLQQDPDHLKQWYQSRWEFFMDGERVKQYEKIKANYNTNPNGADLLFISRSCYGGVIRFRKADGYISTPIGIHSPIHPDTFAKRVDLWHERTLGTTFRHSHFEVVMAEAKAGDLIYCDPPYTDTQTIIYGAQAFDLQRLLTVIEGCKRRGVFVALSLDGSKKTGKHPIHVALPDGLFETEALVNCGRSMLRRFQMEGQSLENHEVSDRLLLTYTP